MRKLCFRCMNAQMAETTGHQEGRDVQFDPYVITGRDRRKHTFQIRSRYGPNGYTLEAFEVLRGRRGGYEFAVISPYGVDILDGYARLILKVRRGLSDVYITRGEHGPRIELDTGIRGRFCWDENERGIPLAVVDGKEYSWRQIGEMLMTFEGFQFRLEIRDRSEDV